MSKLYRVEAYVLDLNGDCPTKESVIENIECNRHPEFISVEDVQETDVGEWNDDHELNRTGCDYRKFFPELLWKLGDQEAAKCFREMRTEWLRQTDRLNAANRENKRLREEIAKLKKVQELVKTIGELTK